MIDLFEELTGVIEALDRESIPYALVGGLGYSILVELRATEDIDLLIRAEDWEKITDVLKPLGFRALAGPMDFEKIRIRRLTKLVNSQALVLDCLFSDGKFDQGLHRAVQFPLRGKFVKVAPPELIIELKKGRMSEKDRSDIAGLEKLMEDQNQ